MSTGQPFVGLFSVVTFGTGSPMEELNGVTAISFTGDKVAIDKTTTMQSVDGIDTFIGSTNDLGTCDLKCDKLPGDTSQQDMETARLAKVAIPFVVTLPGALGARSFNGIIESATVSIPLDKHATIDYKIKITGPWVDTF